MAIDPLIKKETDVIRNEQWADKVRSSIANGLDYMSEDVVEIDNRQKSLESDFVAVQQDARSNAPSGAELAVAAGEYNTLGERLDAEEQKVAAQLAQNMLNDLQLRSYVDLLQQQVTSMGDISPEPYSTYTDLVNADPNHSGVYVVSEDGNWYYWNSFGNLWDVGGKFQSSGIADGSIDYNHLSFIDDITLFVSNTIVQNGDFSKDSDGDGVGDNFRMNDPSSTNKRIDNNRQYWLPVGSAWAHGLTGFLAPFGVKNHKYYISFNQKNIRAVNYTSGNEVVSGLSGSEGRISKVFTLVKDLVTPGQIIFYPAVGNKETYVGNILTIDLTESFGVGNEPTLEEFEIMLHRNNIGYYFEGTKNLLNINNNTIWSARDLAIISNQGFKSKNVEGALNEIANGQIDSDRVTFINKPENIFNKEGRRIENGYYTLGNTWNADPNYFTIEVTDVIPGSTYKHNIPNQFFITFRDENNSQISNLANFGDTITVPNDKRIKIMTTAFLYNNAPLDDVMVVENTLPKFYVPYRKTLEYGITEKLVTAGMDVLIFGDSNTETHYLLEDGTGYGRHARTNWPDWLQPLLDVNIKNYAKSGAGYTHERALATSEGDTRRSILNQIDMAIANNEPADIIIVDAGTNDNKGLIGDLESTFNKKNREELNENYLYEAARWAFWRLKEHYPNAVLFVATPTQRADLSPFSRSLERKAIIDMAQYYNGIIIDATFESGITREFEVINGAGRYLTDGLHMNDEGKKLKARLHACTILNAMRLI